MGAAEGPQPQVWHRSTDTGDPPLSRPQPYQHMGLWLGVTWGWGLLGQWCLLDWQCPYLDKVLVDPFGKGFLLDAISLICKRGEGQVSQWHWGGGTAKTGPRQWHCRAQLAQEMMSQLLWGTTVSHGVWGEETANGDWPQRASARPAPTSSSTLSAEIRSVGQGRVLVMPRLKVQHQYEQIKSWTG